MKIELNSIDRDNFIVTEHEWNGELLYLVIPKHIGAKFTKETMMFRSSVWNSDGELVSASFKKFFNWGEHPELTPPPSSLKGVQFIEKLDGSTMIVSKYKGDFIIRTRGTIDASLMEKNGHEVEELMIEYPMVKQLGDELSDSGDWTFSLIFEWTSPLNQIVIRFDKADIRLIGAINHEDYTLWTQKQLDGLADTLGVRRPQIFNFTTTEEMITTINNLKGKEGIVVYFNNGQSLLKLKSDWYLALHRMKSELSSIDGVVELYMTLGGKLSYNEFYQYIVNTFDYELAEIVRGHLSKTIDAKKNADNIIQGMNKFVESIKLLKTRKEQALKIIDAYGNTNRAGFVFTLLDGRPLEVKDIKKLIFQSLK